jgi:uncharacterized protein YukE
VRGGAAVADETETAEAGAESAPSNAELAGRVDALDSKLDRIIDMFSGKKDQAHAAAQEHTEERLDRPSTIAEEIRAQLEAQRKAEAADAEKRSHADRLAAVEEKVTGMTEKTPETPPRRIERMMWGAR